MSYARSGGVAIAYQVAGDGPVDLVTRHHLTNLYLLWQGKATGPFLRRLAEKLRLVVFNPRGTGLSDRPRNVTLEARMDDIIGVLDAVGSRRQAWSGRPRARTSAPCSRQRTRSGASGSRSSRHTPGR